MQRLGHDGVGERIAIHVAGRQREAARRVFGRRDRLVVGHRRVIDRVDRDRDRRSTGGEPAIVAHGEGERITAVVVLLRRVGEVRRGAGERAVQGLCGDGVGERVAIHVRAL